MNITYKNSKKTTKKFQQGGPMEAPVEAPAPEEQAPAEAPAEGGEDPIAQLAQIFAQGLQNQDCQALAQGAQMFLELMQQQAAPEQPQEPVFKKGGKLAYRIKK